MSLRTGEWDRGPRRLGFCQRVSPTVANYRKLRPMPGDDLLEPPCWSPLENPEPDSRRSDAPRVHGQPSELVLVRSEEMFSESRGSIAISMFEDARPSSSRSQSRGRWQPRSETIIEPVVLTDEDWKGTTYEGPRGLDPGDQPIWREQAAPPYQSTSRGRGPQLEDIFYRNIRRLAWISGVSDAALRNNLGGHRLARFFPVWALNASQCTASTVTLGNNPVSVFHEVSKSTQREKLRQVERNARPREPGSTFDTRSRYDVPQRTVYVPLGLVNDSVPGNSTMFAFHLSRVAVRLFSSLVRIASETELIQRGDLQLLYDDLLGCFARDFRALPGSLRSQPERVVTDADDGSYAMMIQTAALRLGFHAFKAHARLRIARGTDVTSRVWLSQLEDIFYRNIRRLAWISGVSDAALRNNLGGHRLARFFPVWALNASQCTASTVTLGNNPVSVFHEVSKSTQREKLRQVERNARPREPGSTFDTRSRYDVPQRTVYVPLGLVNDSVPGNSTMFAFHLSRVAVRLFSSLVRIASETELIQRGDLQLLYDDLLGCFARDFRALPGSLRSQPERVVTDADDGSYAMMIQTAALRLGFHAFKELLHVQRIWGVNFRLQNLEDTSSEQLFFLYYALDNCERSDEAFKVHEYVREKRLPPHYQVNLPLRHLPEFTEAFQCGQGTAMKLPPNAVCKVFNTSYSV
ncbi:hypothetical protein ISCGN_011768 [Ixodes scapularis]